MKRFFYLMSFVLINTALSAESINNVCDYYKSTQLNIELQSADFINEWIRNHFQTEKSLQEFEKEFRKQIFSDSLESSLIDKLKILNAVELEKMLGRMCFQPEFTKTYYEYFIPRITKEKIEIGVTYLNDYNQELDFIEKQFGVDRSILLSIWSGETNYGRFLGDLNVADALYTAVFFQTGKKQKFFLRELKALLKIISESDGALTKEAVVGSWAGAMGHTQFMPTTYQRLFIAYDLDKAKSPFSVKDSLISSANLLLKDGGWIADLTWGERINLEKGVDWQDLVEFDIETQENRINTTSKKFNLNEWMNKGVSFQQKGDLQHYWKMGLFSNEKFSFYAPLGAKGPLYLVSHNFYALKRYNNSDFYALTIGLMSQMMTGKASLKEYETIWPVVSQESTISKKQKYDLQSFLLDYGYFDKFYTEEQRKDPKFICLSIIDGKFGTKTVAAFTEYQKNKNWLVDGYINKEKFIAMDLKVNRYKNHCPNK